MKKIKSPIKEFKDSMQDLVNKSEGIDSISISTEINGSKKEIGIIAKKEEEYNY